MGMLFVARQQVSKEQICQMYGVDFKKIMKNPSFEVAKEKKWKDRANGNVIRSGKGMGSRSHFMATDPETKMKVEIRYAQSHVPKQVGNVLQDVFEPRYVQFMGMKKAFQNDPELAIYWYLHPNNSESPLRDPKNKAKAKIEYIDNKKRADAKNANIDILTDALSHAKNLDESEVIILAKGLGIKGVSGKEIDAVRADLREYAYKFPKLYQEKADSSLTYYEGKLIHLVDTGIIKLTTMGSVRRWSWAKGQKEGEVITDVTNSSQDAKLALKNYVFSNLNDYMYLLNNITDELNAKQKAEQFLASLEQQPKEAIKVEVVGDGLPDYLKNVNQEPVLATGSKLNINSFAEAVAYLTERDGKRPSNADASKWFKQLKGEV